jgi:outer membrane immunogenic protein
MFGRFFTVAALALAVTEGTAAWADAGQTIGRLAWPGGWPSAARHFQADDQGDVGSAAAADPDDRTLYVTGMIGSSFAAAEGGSLGGRLFTGEAALGVAVPRPAGAVRLEFEGRQRAALSGRWSLSGDDGEPVAASIDGEWTTLGNVWRDVAVGERAGLYAGGGVGIGGYRQAFPSAADETGGRVTDFAWQVGGGATYAVAERVTFDAGYRLYGVGAGRGVEPAGEIVFAVRIADPLRGWLRR